MSDLNPEQLAALQALASDNVAVLAGPGSGKTHTLTAAVRATLQQQPTANLLCLTFTTKAAEQLAALLPRQANLFIGTFHAFSAQLLRAVGSLPAIADSQTLIGLLAELKRSRDLQGLNARELQLIISRYKNGSLVTNAARRLTRAYDFALAERGLIDYDDLILRALSLATQQTAYDYILVDEFQDTSPKQYELLQALSDAHTRCFVIGDPKQSIYRFRGADGSVFDKLQADAHPRRISLSANYRSAPAIVQAANQIFPEQAAQQAKRPDGGAVHCVETLDEYTEADYVSRSIEQALGGTEWQHTHHDTPVLAAGSFSDFAVLYRTRRQGALLAQKLRGAGLPVQCLGEDSPYATPLSQLIKSLLRYTLQPDEPTWRLVESTAGIAKLTIRSEALTERQTTGSPSQRIHHLTELLGQDTNALQQLENLASRFTKVTDLLDYLDRLSEQSFFDNAADAVCLSTIHASKGLEFRHVFVAGCNAGLLPSSRATEDEDKAEELRLFYVAITRARDSLTLLCDQRLTGKPAQPSSFLKLLGVPLQTDEQLAAIQHTRARRRQKRAQQRLF